jgi:hypothetical protein
MCECESQLGNFFVAEEAFIKVDFEVVLLQAFQNFVQNFVQDCEMLLMCFGVH